MSKPSFHRAAAMMGLVFFRAAFCCGQPIALIDGISPFLDPAKPPVRTWSMPFEHLGLPHPPYADLPHLQRSQQRFQAYCRRVRALGYNGVTLGNLIHLTVFDRLPEGPNAIYAPSDPYRLRHNVYKCYFRKMVELAHTLGLQVIVETDFPAWTPPVLRYLGREGLSMENPRLWILYRTGIRELFDDLQIDGVSVRIGEGGGAYNDPLVRYSSTVLVRRVEDAQEVIRQLLEPIEVVNRISSKAHRLFFRTWTIGLGPIGNLHTNPAVYEQVFGPFYHRKDLITVIKHVAMDFYDYVPRNPTIGIGGLQQIVEFQARREFEGFNLFPNYRGGSFQEDLRVFTTLRQFAGISVWATNGGFLFKAPVYYGITSHDEWIDLNVQAYAKLLEDPVQDSRVVLDDWLAARGLSRNDRTIAAPLLMRSEQLIRKGLYLSDYAKQKVGLLGLERIPSMLWLWWTRPTTAYGIQCLIFRELRDEAAATTIEGYEAVRETEGMLAEAEKLSRTSFRERLLESLQYEKSVLEVLAGYRAAFLNHYWWALSGKDNFYREWQAASRQLKESTRIHRDRFRESLFFPTLDLREVDRMTQDDEAQPALRPFAALAAILCLANVILILKSWLAWSVHIRVLGGLLGVLLVAASQVIFVSGHSAAVVASVSMIFTFGIWLLASAAIVLTTRKSPKFRKRIVEGFATSSAVVVPLLLLQIPLMTVYAFRGPVPTYWLLVSALSQSWARWSVLCFGTAAVGSSVFSAYWVAAQAGGKKLKLTLICSAANALAWVVAFSFASRFLPDLNRIYRIGPSVFGEAGPGVKELSSVSLSKHHKSDNDE